MQQQAVDSAAEQRKLSPFQPHTPLPLTARLANTRVFNTREGYWLPATCIVCMSASGLKSCYTTMYVNDQCFKLLCVHVQACVYDISMATKSPILPLGTWSWQTERSGQRELCVCVANVLTLCRGHGLEAAAPAGISTGAPYWSEKDRPLCLCDSVADWGPIKHS